MNASTQSIAKTTSPLEHRFIIAKVLDQTLAIPAGWVAEILRVDKNKILNLPFYKDLVLGVTHHSGRVLPLLSTHLLIGKCQVDLRETLTVVRLGSVAGDVVEVGLVVDQVVRSAMQFELPVETVFFDLQMMQLDLWQPCA